MKSTPVGLDPSVQSRSRWSRLGGAVAALMLSVNCVFAQTYGVSTYAGAALQASNTDTAVGPATLARFNTPKGIAVDSAGNVYVADAVNNAIRKIAVTTGITTTIVSGAPLSSPGGVAVDTAGNLYVANSGAHTILKIVGTTVTTLAGSAASIGLVDNATGTTARFFNPTGIAVNGAGTIAYVADTSNHLIRRIDLTGTFAVTTVAGTVTSGAGVSGTDNNATGTAAKFNNPYALALDAGGTNLFIADRNNHAIRQIALTGTNAVTTFAGTAGTFGSTDSPALFRNPEGIAITAAGVLFVSDSGNVTIRSITSAGAVATIAGSAGQVGVTDGLGSAARFQEPFGIAVHSSGVVYVADAASQVIRRLAVATAPGLTTPIGNPANFTVATGGTITLTSTYTGSPTPTFQWQRQPAAGGGFTALTIASPYSVSTTGSTATLTITGVPASLSGDQFRVVASNGVSPDATSSPVTIVVNQPPTMANGTVTGNFTVDTAGTFVFTASGSPAPDLLILSGNFPAGASLTQSKTGATTTGTITWTPSASQVSGSPYTFTIRATNGVGTDATQQFTLSILSGPVVTSHPASPTVSPGLSAQFTVGVSSNAGSLSYQWQRQQVGTVGFVAITDNGVYVGTSTQTLTVNSVTLPMSGDQFRVVVSSGVGTPATSNAGILTVTQSPQITSLNSTSFVENQFSSFQVQATGSPAPVYSITSGSLPSGVSLNPSSGVLSGTPAVGTSATPTYNFQITASNGVAPEAVQSFVLTVSPTSVVPTFTTQPQSVSIALGQTTTFTAVATGTPTPTLQWQRQPNGSFGFNDIQNDTTFSGVTTTTLTITNPTSGMSGDIYRVVASNSTGSNASSGATLTIIVGTTISTYAGTAGFPGATDATGTAARFNSPAAVAVDLAGNLYIADSSNHVIRKISSGGVVTTLAGSPGLSGSTDGVGTAARFNAPAGIAVNSVGTVYVADTFNHTIRVISSGGAVTTLAGSAGISGTADAQGTGARFTYPSGVAIDSSGVIYVADSSNHTIRRIQTDGSVSVLAGAPGQRGAVNDTGTNARFAFPNGVAVDISGNVYVADSFNHCIRKITPFGGVSTLAGSFGIGGSTDVPALFNQPSGVAVDTAGNVYVADTFNQLIRKITPAGAVTTQAGSPSIQGSADGIGNAARFNQPYGIAVDAAGTNIFVADTRNHTIRRTGTVTAPQIQTQPQNALAAVGGTASFTVTATGAPAPSVFQWTRQPAGTIGFVTLSNDGVYSGVTSSTLSITNVTQEMNGDQFQVVVSNFISPNATSSAATLVIGVAPVFTSAAIANFQATVAGSFQVTASGTPAPTFSATGLPSWATLNPVTGAITGTPPDTTGSPFTATVTATNGISATQTLTIAVAPAVLPPTITGQPASLALNQGQTATFSVVAAGTAPFTYQWRRDGIAISGVTGSSLSLNAQPAAAGVYSVVVTNAVGSATSQGATLSVNTGPVFVSQPRSQAAEAGATVTFSVSVTGGSLTYQWRRNGSAIAGATNATLTLNSVTTADAGNYDVTVTNGLGQVGSSIAQLNIVTGVSAPVITSQPSARAVLVGRSTTLSVSATGVPAPFYQWRKDGTGIAGANGSTYVIGNAQAGDAGSYDVVVSNSAGSVLSAPAGVRVLARSYAGTYFGSFGNNLGTYAIFVREDNTGVFLGYIPGNTAPVISLNLTVNDAGAFSFAQSAILAGSEVSPVAGEPGRAAALSAVTVSGTLGADGTVSGSIQGGATGSLSGNRSSDLGVAQTVAGYYQAGSGTSAATAYTIAGANGQAFVVTQSGTASDGGTGTVAGSGQVTVTTTRTVISQSISAGSGTITGSSTGAVNAIVTGGSDTANALQRLVNISSRARVAAGDAAAIAGFVISGSDSKPVLIRAVGPSLALAPFGIASALTTPRLELFRGTTSLAVNAGIGTNRAAIDAAGQQSGAFPLGSAGNDAAILTTLAPGNYTAVVSSTVATGAGVALVEVYDLSAASPGQKLLNIATRASAGAGDNLLIAGFVVPPGAAKRVIVRAVGPGLAPFNITGFLAQPTLLLLSGSTTIAQNTNWLTSPDRDIISSASASVGAFGLATNDSAVVLTLAPGNYTAQVIGAGTTTGIALIEVYELP